MSSEPRVSTATSRPSRYRKAAAWSVHLLTASGAAWGLLALLAIDQGRFKLALVWMGVAVIVDGIDGPLARSARVSTVLPGFDGTLLDNIVDYLNYVIVPAYFLLHAPLVPPALALPAGLLICVSSAYQFSQADAKTSDHFFKGFPSYWNVVVLYLTVLRPDPRLAFAVIVALSILVFVPVRFVYPSRTPDYRPLTLVLTTLWILCAAAMIFMYPYNPPWLTWGSLLYLVYYLALSVMLTARQFGRL